jgi:hypothetical protein
MGFWKTVPDLNKKGDTGWLAGVAFFACGLYRYFRRTQIFLKANLLSSGKNKKNVPQATPL